MDLSAHFMQLSLNATTTITSYAFLIDTGYFFRHFVYFNTGYKSSWTLYGSLGSDDGTAPTSPTDPSWVLVDSQSDVDFSTPQNFLNPGLFTYTFVNGSSVTYQYFGFVTTLVPPMHFLEVLKPYINPVTQIDFCS